MGDTSTRHSLACKPLAGAVGEEERSRMDRAVVVAVSLEDRDP